MSWLIASACCGILIGVVGVQYISQDFFGSAVWGWVGISAVVLVLWRRSVFLIPLVLLGGMVIGLWRGSIDMHALLPYEKIAGHVVTIRGSVSEDPDKDPGGNVVLRLAVTEIDTHELGGKVWVSTKTPADVKRGDIVTVNGKLGEGFGNFSGVIYRANTIKVQRPEPGDVAGRVRDWFASGIRGAIPEPAASLGIGYLVGQRRSLPPELDEALKIAGLTHVVVASGYNLTILVRLARRLFVKISKYLSALAAAGMIVAFIGITGASPSMSRAGLVAGLSLLAWYYGRKFHPLVLLPFAAAVTVLVNPSYAWGDLGWQLSFAAFAGVMVMAPLAQAYFFGDKKPGTVRQILGETIAAQIATLPILILAFGQFSNVAILANLLVLPFVPLAMLLTFIAGVGALVAPGIAVFVGTPATWLLQYMTEVARYLAHLPWALSQVNSNAGIVVIMYGFILVGCAYMWLKTKFHLRDANLVE